MILVILLISFVMRNIVIEFVAGGVFVYVKHSEFLLTNSFHGTVFSIIFEKNFVTMPNLDTGNRITEFLSKLNLSSHCTVDIETALLCFTEKINYSTTKMLISDLRKKSIEYLKKNTLL